MVKTSAEPTETPRLSHRSPWFVCGFSVTVKRMTNASVGRTDSRMPRHPPIACQTTCPALLPSRGVEAGALRGAAERGAEEVGCRGRRRLRLRGCRGRLQVAGTGFVAHAVPGVAGIRSGMRSRGGIGVPPRTTTMERNRSSTFSAASTSAVAAPPITPRRNQRGPSTPMNRARRLPAVPSAPAATGTSASSSGPRGPSRSSTRPPCWRI